MYILHTYIPSFYKAIIEIIPSMEDKLHVYLEPGQAFISQSMQNRSSYLFNAFELSTQWLSWSDVECPRNEYEP